MSCECENIICLEVLYNSCSEGARLNIVADYAGDMVALIEFNNVWTAFSFGVVAGEKIVIPTEYLNEIYTHGFKLFDEAGELINCYNLKSRAVKGAQNFTPITPGIMGQVDVLMVIMGEPEDELNNVFGVPVHVVDGNTIQVDTLKGKALISVEKIDSQLVPVTGIGVNSFDPVTGLITLSGQSSNTYFKIIYKKVAV